MILQPEEAVTAAKVGCDIAADVPLEPEDHAIDLHTRAKCPVFPQLLHTESFAGHLLLTCLLSPQKKHFVFVFTAATEAKDSSWVWVSLGNWFSRLALALIDKLALGI